MRRWTAETDDELKKILASGLSAKTAAEKLGFCRFTVQVQIKRLGLNTFRHMTEEEKKKLVELHAARKTDQQIADILGRGVATIHKWRVSLGLGAHRFQKPREKLVLARNDKSVTKAYTLDELKRPTLFAPGTKGRANVESQRKANGIPSHPQDAS